MQDDIRSQEQLDQAVSRVPAGFGQIGNLIVNAGIWTMKPFRELNVDRLGRVERDGVAEDGDLVSPSSAPG